jgi:hypothetical protein
MLEVVRVDVRDAKVVAVDGHAVDGRLGRRDRAPRAELHGVEIGGELVLAHVVVVDQ